MGERKRRLAAERERLGREAGTRQPLLHRLKQSCAISVHAPKTAALIFEKIAAPAEDIGEAPYELLTYSRNGQTLSTAMQAGGPDPDQRTITIQVRERSSVPGSGFVLVTAPTRASLIYALNKVPDQYCQHLQETGLRPVLCYPGFSSDMEAFRAGDYSFVLACISGLGVVDEAQLTWQQVMAFREDELSRLNLARFLNWLNIDMNGKTKAQIQDELCAMYESGQGALRKFGIYLSQTTDALFGMSEERTKNIVSLAGVAGAAGSAATDHPLAAMLLGGFTLGQGVWCGVRRAHAKIRRERDAMAFIYGLRQMQASVAQQSSPSDEGWKLYSDNKWTF